MSPQTIQIDNPDEVITRDKTPIVISIPEDKKYRKDMYEDLTEEFGEDWIDGIISDNVSGRLLQVITSLNDNKEVLREMKKEDEGE